MKRSDWQDGVPQIEGVYEILVVEYKDNTFDGIYAARFKNGKWDSGHRLDSKLSQTEHTPYPRNNDPDNPRPWRGVIEE